MPHIHAANDPGDDNRIDELSARLNDKLVDLQKQKLALHQAHQSLEDPAARQLLENDMAALSRIERKLEKSRELAWQAYRLRQQSLTNTKRLHRRRRLALGLFLFGSLGAAFLLGLLIWQAL